MINYGIDPERDPHRNNPEPHWRLYDAPRAIGPTTIEVQDFDYRDYEAGRFMTAQAYDTEEEAQLALETYQFLVKLQRTRSPEDRLWRAIEELDNIAISLKVNRDADHAVQRLRDLQRELIR